MDSLNDFCGITNGTFQVWDSHNKNFGQCFVYLAVSCPAYAILLLTSSFYAGKKPLLIDFPTPFVVKIRILIAWLLAIQPLIEVACIYLLQEHHPLDITLTNSLITITWIINSLAIWKSRHRSLIQKCLPWPLVIATLIVLLSSAVHLYFVIHSLVIHTSHHPVINYGAIVRSTLLLIYLMSFINCGNDNVFSEGVPHVNAPAVQAHDHEHDRLLRSVSQGTYYSSIQCVSDDLGVAEDPYNPLSKLFFCWVRRLMLKGFKGLIQSEEDLFMLSKSLRTSHVQDIFLKEFYWSPRQSSEPRRNLSTKSSYSSDLEESDSYVDVRYPGGGGDDVFCSSEVVQKSLLSALHHSFGWQYYSLGVLKLLGDGLGFVGPLLLHALVSFMEIKEEPMAHGYYYATGLFMSTLLCAFINAHFSYWVNKVGLKMRAAIITTVYQKSLSVSSASLAKFSTGEVVNFMSTDTDRVVNFCPSFHQFWSLPFQVAVSLYLLHQQVGLAFLAGLGFAIIVIPINRWLAIKIQELSKDMMTRKDSRVKIMNEILYGIRVIKFYAWERNFEDKINDVRSQELKSLKGRKYLDAWCVYFWATTPVIISILTFTTYSLLGNQLTAAKVFTSVALFNMLISPLNAFPWVLNGLMEAWVSIQRLQSFLELEDLDTSTYYSEMSNEESKKTDVKIVNGQFSWRNKRSDQDDNNGDNSVHNTEVTQSAGPSHTVGCLSNINITLKKCKLIGVIGGVGSGKSSLLSAITAEMDKNAGTIFVSSLVKGFGLAAQEPWIQHATVKENILFGQPFDVEKYHAVVEACALEEDFLMLPSGDETEVGENGVTLSGGQKARVSLARAVYQDKDIYLLDDPLAAVDSHVASHLFQHCIQGLLRHKTVILCTHHIKYLKSADHIIVMNSGLICHQGLPSEILSKESLISQISRESKATDEESDFGSDSDEKSEKNEEEDVRLVEKERKDEGTVKLHVYGSYWVSIGHCLATSILVSLLLMQASRNLSDWWLSYWISHSKANSYPNNTSEYSSVTSSSNVTQDGLGSIHIVKGTVTFYLVVYAGFAVSNTIFTLFRAFLFAYGGVKAARVLHQRLLSSILTAPVSFFDATPIGRIINRFSSDMYSIDDSLPFILNIFLAQAYGVLGTVVITCYGLPWLTILLIPLALIYYYIQNYYRRTSRELKRLMSVTLSPIYAHFSETLTGLSTIRALRETRQFQNMNVNKLDINQRANFCAMAASQWLSLQLQFLGVAMVTGVAFIAVLEHHFSFRSVDPGLVGLAISYALSVTDRLSGMVTSFTETEKQMVSVERAVEYIEDIPSEQSGNAKISPYWPSIGQITFKDVVLVYRQGLLPALSNVSFEVKGGEKIGIVGRTGSGKSSLFLVLFRMVNIQEGLVIIDGLGVASLPLDQLRSRLAIIPQDPFLFSGSVRSNVDPWSKHSDSEVWTILQRCHINLAIRDMGGLDADVGERGRNFSVGQRQLVCLARALLSQAKILCVDEATASVDLETDELIQQTIRDEFRNSTVLTIAHRIETIMDSDRVLVMDRGTVAEFDHPSILLTNRNSLFSAFVYGS